MAEALRAPFPYPGGKMLAAATVWRAFGADIPNYIEGFAGSAAVLLRRPGGPGKIETLNDLDGFVTNVHRAIRSAPEEVAKWCDWPVSELDLHARHKWLVNQTEAIERMRSDPDFFDAKIAGWWLWGIAQWIGGGWCSVPKNNGLGTVGGKKRPILDGIGKGINGLNAYSPGRRPAIGGTGMGVHLPSLGNDRGIHGVSAPPCMEWFEALAKRLRRVRIVCGDFERVLGPSVLGKGENVGGRRPCGVFLDPTYDHDLRSGGLYRCDAPDVSRRAREWAIANGDDPDLRIALCGYVDEHGPHMPANWTVHRWKGRRGYAGADNKNREKEAIFFSPHCLPIDQQPSLFGGAL